MRYFICCIRTSLNTNFCIKNKNQTKAPRNHLETCPYTNNQKSRGNVLFILIKQQNNNNKYFCLDKLFE